MHMKIYLKTLAVFYVSRTIFQMIEALLYPDVSDVHFIMATFPAVVTAVVYVLEYQRMHKDDDVTSKDITSIEAAAETQTKDIN